MDRFYLTENIYLLDDAMFYNKIKITNNNWHNYLNEYGWEKLPLLWIKKLNKLTTMKYKNSRYGIIDFPPDGNCFFHCLSYSLNEKNRSEILNYKDIRNILAESITDKQYNTIMSYYKIMQDANDFDENWNPYEIKNIDEFKRKLRESTTNYWGDYLLLTYLTENLKLNIIILNNEQCNLYNTLLNYNENYDSIFLLYIDENHFNLIGHFDKQMKSYFKHNEIPEAFIKLIHGL